MAHSGRSGNSCEGQPARLQCLSFGVEVPFTVGSGKGCTFQPCRAQEGGAHTSPDAPLACPSIAGRARCSELLLISAEEGPTAFPGVLVTGPEQESHPYQEWVLTGQL